VGAYFPWGFLRLKVLNGRIPPCTMSTLEKRLNISC